ncbi:MBL fold metallo-hydrolase [Flavobacterium terrae]|uniref:L-ascorbate metabolism protein UlaG, beta-lactamase superfamily n=1 Tax=Flavobacterium terrae TaxID=415425 RepID=A0A1M6ESZ7_9FLAO|nr:MBL fold metallo-hydrolase [Flavobacterium terrae]SHI88469.1 L-ascorbate metabolism protein UlaG, beta-lactamase superfamily [Flavobacterium terrae]
MMYFTITTLIALIIAFTILFLKQPQFGKEPSDQRLEKIKKSPQFKNGKFENISYTPALTQGHSMLGILYKQLFGNNPNTSPSVKIPSVKTNLKELKPEDEVFVWFGHSSYFFQIEGVRFLIDPVFSGNASPIPGVVSSFDGSNNYQVSDLPDIDYLLITHDHYDHLDYKTIKELKGKVKLIVCGLGVGSHFEYWGFNKHMIVEKDWNETIDLDRGIKLHTTPARHFSGRALKRNNTLWLSFVLETSNQKIFLGGDSGYDSHFKIIGDKFGPFDLVLLENGQYNDAWEAIHLLPNQVLKAATDLRAKQLIPMHSSKFKLAMHPWDEPLEKVSKFYKEGEFNFMLLTPMIGEQVILGIENQVFSEWWKMV